MYGGFRAKLEITRNETTETREIYLQLHLYSENYFECCVRIVNEKGVLYDYSMNMNGEAEGSAIASIPANLDFSKAYVEYFSNQYMGESIKIDCLGTVPYVGKYGDSYKYRANLANVKTEFIETPWGSYTYIALSDFSYRGSKNCNGFKLCEDYVIDNEVYIEKEETNTDTKLKFDLIGKYTGAVKAEEVSKSDLIYGKVEEKLNKHSAEDLYMWIGNVYIENGSFEGYLKLTFNVGEQYNGKNYFVTHMKNEKYEFEEFTGIVKDGKIEILVDSLSPFGVSIFENKTTTETENKPVQPEEATQPTKPTEPTNKGEKDETPKTGTIDIIGYVLTTTILAGVGIVVLKKNVK